MKLVVDYYNALKSGNTNAIIILICILIVIALIVKNFIDKKKENMCYETGRPEDKQRCMSTG